MRKKRKWGQLKSPQCCIFISLRRQTVFFSCDLQVCWWNLQRSNQRMDTLDSSSHLHKVFHWMGFQAASYVEDKEMRGRRMERTTDGESDAVAKKDRQLDLAAVWFYWCMFAQIKLGYQCNSQFPWLQQSLCAYSVATGVQPQRDQLSPSN